MRTENRSHTVPPSLTLTPQTAAACAESGFTLLELIIVLFLITVMLGLSGVFFANALPSGRFNASSREIVSTIRQARHLAQINGENQVVTIDMDSKRYAIEGRSEKQLPAGIGISIVDPFAGEIVSGKYRMIFYSSGGSGAGTVILRDKSRTAYINMDPIAGAVIIK